MRAFSGVEPLVGEIVGLRTFRVDESGLLLPLFSNDAWYDGPNTADCTPPTGDRRRFAHAVPADDCECGFYAYGTEPAAAQNKQFRYVQAAVSCWGGVVAGTQGFRAQHARIDAVWLHPQAPRSLRSRVAQRYPSARMYADAEAMRAEHPPTELGCYQQPETRSRSSRLALAFTFAFVVALGLMPWSWLGRSELLFGTWILATAGAAALTGWLAVGTRGIGHLAAAAVAAGVLAWLIAPLFGVSGWLLRVPLLRGIVIATGGYLLALRRRHFPVVPVHRPRAFCGVRP